MQLLNQARAPFASVAVLLALGPLLQSCAVDITGAPGPDYSRLRESRRLDPVGKQTGRLTVVALDFADGRPLNKAMVDVVASYSANDTYHYRRMAPSNQFGMVTFNDVPPTVDVVINHMRGTYAVDGYPVPQSGTSEFRVYIETTSPRTANEDR
jgi:hypothetical protein